MFDIVFLSRVIPYSIKSEILKKRKKTMSESGESLQWKIIEGINENIGSNITLFNFMPIQSWPMSYTEPFVKGGEYKHTDGTKIVNIPFNNVFLIKRFLMGRPLYKEIRKWAKSESKNTKVLISYSLTPEFLESIKIAKKINKDIKAVAIVADLPEYTVLEEKPSFFTRIYLNWLKKSTNKKIDYIDGFSLLTKQMSEKLINRQQKYTVIEGICSELPNVSTISKEKYILYAGTLHQKFGIKILLDAFVKLKDPNIKLYLCGIGDSVDLIAKYAETDKRIVYKGQLTRDEVLELLLNAYIVVNPRTNEGGEFTKYSFPSKNLEALSCGKPFVSFKLPGIPEEYEEFINYAGEQSDLSLSTTIEDICLNYDFYYEKAKRAKEWVLIKKGKVAQTKKIIDLIKEVVNG